MTTIAELAQFLECFAPSRLAEDWDNVGLLVGDRALPATRVMTCLTITPASAEEAIRRQASCIVTHHPLPFRPLKQLNTDTTASRLLWQLARAGVCVYSPHTAFDSAADGINQRLAAGLGLTQIAPLAPALDDPDGLGAGRVGLLETPTTLSEFAAQVRSFLKIAGLHAVGDAQQTITRVAVACGSAGSFLPNAVAADCDLLVTGETTFHTCLEAEAAGIALLLPGHYASERFAVEELAGLLAQQFPQLECWASQDEADPLRWLS